MDEELKKIADDGIRKVRELMMSAEEEIGEETFRDLIEDIVLEDGLDISLAEADMLAGIIYSRTRGRLGPLGELIEDAAINEIMVNGKDDIYFENDDGIFRLDDGFDSVEELEEIIRNIAASVHKEVHETSPILDARLPDGSRVNAVYKNIAAAGPVLTIRKFRSEVITFLQMLRYGTLTEECRDFLITMVVNGYNIFISGGTSSGKTTFLNALTEFIPPGDRVIIIEDSRELQPVGIDNLVQMECHSANSMGRGEVTMEMLIRTSLRMRPDRIIVGEVRGPEVAEMLQAMNTGHDGSFSTGHGNSVKGMLRRLEAMYLMSAQHTHGRHQGADRRRHRHHGASRQDWKAGGE
jgi:pilus assembly protein CpaF